MFSRDRLSTTGAGVCLIYFMCVCSYIIYTFCWFGKKSLTDKNKNYHLYIPINRQVVFYWTNADSGQSLKIVYYRKGQKLRQVRAYLDQKCSRKCECMNQTELFCSNIERVSCNIGYNQVPSVESLIITTYQLEIWYILTCYIWYMLCNFIGN